MLKPAIAVLVLLLALASVAQTPPPPVTDVSSGQIQSFINALPRNAVSDRPIRVVDVGGYHVGVFGVFRPKTIKQEANLHQTKVTEIYYILKGTGTLVTGGTLPDPHPLRPGSTTLQSTHIEGGHSRKVSPGDVVIIPGHTPHWFSSQNGDLEYLIFRPDPDGTIALK
jgi:mannose-6-phosphate isomerase-like protein (cupin superfamily)